MNRVYLIFCITFISFSLFGRSAVSIIPQPSIVVLSDGEFVINQQTVITYEGNEQEITQTINQFQSQFKLVSGIELKKISKAKSIKSQIIFNQIDSLDFSAEQYRLNITKNTITLTARTGAGFFYALQTLYQLMPTEIYSQQPVEKRTWSVPYVYIDDKPRFPYRGLHLDVSRHFFSVDEIKKYIDAMAIHKFNTFHWHLTDDQGWRLEIKKYPDLVNVGSRRNETLVGHSRQNFPRKYNGKPYSGYYTQEDAREVVRYAKERFITVIPEIEMPGHAQAAVASYPFLSCRQDASVEVATRWGVFKEVFCPREETFAFLENVLTEVLDIFPSEYIHIGGDECPKTRWEECPDCQARIKSENLKDEEELQSYFIKRIERFLNNRGRQIIGWDEILEGGTSPNTTVMSWRGNKGGIEAAKLNRKVIMTPMYHCYFDFYQGADQSVEPLAIGGFIDVKRVYEYEPIPAVLTEEESRYIIGAQANLWAEYIPDYSQVEYMVYPRASALSEVLWGRADKDWESFCIKLAHHLERLKHSGINCSQSFSDVLFQSEANENNELTVSFDCYYPNAKIRYTLDGSSPTDKSPLYVAPISLSKSGKITATGFVGGNKIGRDTSKEFIVSKLTGKTYTPRTNHLLYNGRTKFALTDGVLGNERVQSLFVGFEKDEDTELIFDLAAETSISRVKVGLLHLPSICMYITPEINVYISLDGEQYFFVQSKKLSITPEGEWKMYRPEVSFNPIKTRYLKIELKYAGFCTPDRLSGGKPSITMIDEVAAW